MKKVLFIDRDGTLINEPTTDQQVDTLEKLDFLPKVLSSMPQICKLDYEIVMVTNQDGLGTSRFPLSAFNLVQNKMLDLFKSVGVQFDAIHIDHSFAYENLPTRKPGVGMLSQYLNSGKYDLANSYVIGDRITDVQLAENLGAKAILFQTYEQGKKMLAQLEPDNPTVLITDDWDQIFLQVRDGERSCHIQRNTKETQIDLLLDLDGYEESEISTGLRFLDHMLEQLVYHAGVSLQIKVNGDIDVDDHHTIEDVAIVLGEAVLKTLGKKIGIERYGFSLPMDECKAQVLIDFGGRPDFVWDVIFKRDQISDISTEMFKHFFKSFSFAAMCNLQISATGENEHHKAEAVFKAFARALNMAKRRIPYSNMLPTSKGTF